MGFLFQTPVTVGGTVLVIERIESQNYSPGVAGWALWADGTADLQAAQIRGNLIVGDPNSNHIEATTINGQPEIDFYTGQPNEAQFGSILAAGPGESFPYLRLWSPQDVGSTAGPAEIVLESYDAAMGLGYENALRFRAQRATVSEPMRWETDEGGFNPFPLAGTWVDFAGNRARYLKDAAGNVHVQGVIASGATVAVGTLPVGYRPSQSVQFPLYGGNPGPTISVIQVSPAGAMTIITNLGAAQVRLALNFTFSTF